jgi:hypothetical protein
MHAFALLLVLLVSIASSQTLTLYTSKSSSGNEVRASSRHSIEFPNSYTLQFTIPASSSLYLIATLETESTLDPAQVFLRFSKKNSAYSGILAFSKKKKKGTYGLSVDIEGQLREYVGQSGEFTVDVLIAGGNVTRPIEWKAAFGNVEIQGGKDKGKEHAKAKPEILHVFREADKRAPSSFALVFTGICIAPLFLFIFLIGRIGFKFGVPAHVLHASIFMVSIAAILGVLVVYWIGISIFYAFRVLAVLGSIALFSGLLAFRNEFPPQVSSSKKTN